DLRSDVPLPRRGITDMAEIEELEEAQQVCGLIFKVFSKSEEAANPNRNAIPHFDRPPEPKPLALATGGEGGGVDFVRPVPGGLAVRVGVVVPDVPVIARLAPRDLQREVQFLAERFQRLVRCVNA